MNEQTQTNKSRIRNTIETYAVEAIVATVFLTTSTTTLCYLLGIEFRINNEYNYDFRALVFSVGIAITPFIATLYLRKRRLPLFLAITIWVLFGLIAYTLLSAVWGSGS
ncbi:hypothetical protein [Actinomyces sp. ZJ308]|uniref:hypothetical protein n=1 Tax=Actinomyces sp. ZJ308 TaxID=2708342 RepID=UPI00141DECDB|nr:hypothetical protein [Actinomyces sp. ZJ308]